ncbi:hypothetical protein BCV70DRAFT_196905 [Testicularia cyperi]|uniref:MIT domain-containing protein n=1 Tax=Testicularia cyperi TaxID=1882483 RepID=A0A317XX25_9BASI|nr:hypothetical protein BCV70DRAFT_196905 [Testicularia cyperi]
MSQQHATMQSETGIAAAGRSRGHSFLSLDEAPSSPTTADTFAPPPRPSRNRPGVLSSLSPSTPEDGQYAFLTDQASTEHPSPGRSKRSPRSSSPPRSSRQKILEGIDHYRLPLSNNPTTSMPPSTVSASLLSHRKLDAVPPQSSVNRPSSRGSRLGAILGRSSANNSSNASLEAISQDQMSVEMSINAASSSIATAADKSSSSDSGFFSRRLRSKISIPEKFQEYTVAAQRLDSQVKPTPQQVSTESKSRFVAPQAARSASAMGVLDVGGTSGTTNLPQQQSLDALRGASRRPRPVSQADLLDAMTGNTANGNMTDAHTHNKRVGRLSRLTYNKTDAISFLAQARTNTTGQPGAVTNFNRDRQSTDSIAGPSSAAPIGYGLGIDATGNTYPFHEEITEPAMAISQRDLVLPALAASQGVDSYAHEVGTFYPSNDDAAQRSDSFDSTIGRASSSNRESSIAGGSHNMSRAPSVASSQRGYHNRFSEQSYTSMRGSATAPAAAAMASGEILVSDGQAMERNTSTSLSATGSAHTSNENSTSTQRGTLSDAAIVALGAVPGSEPQALLNADGTPLSSKNILTIALQKAQSAVQLDSANNVPEAIAAYRQAVRLLQEVMERIAPRHGKRSRPSREEERRRLRVIHDTYADRIRLLSMIYSPDLSEQHQTTSADTSYDAYPSVSHLEPNGMEPEPRPEPEAQGDWLERVRGKSRESPSTSPQLAENSFLPSYDAAPIGADEKSFLAITPVRSTFQQPSSAKLAPAASSTSSDAATPRPETLTPAMSSPGKTITPRTGAQPPSPALQASPRRGGREDPRPGSSRSRGSRASVSLSIAEEQEVREHAFGSPRFSEGRAPHINVQHVLPSTTATDNEEVLRDRNDPLASIREADGASLHNRSESDSSYKSANLAANRLRSTGNRISRAYGLEDELKTPMTPYFDAADVGSVGFEPLAVRSTIETLTDSDSSNRRGPAEQTEEMARTEQTERREKTAKMGLAQRARALSFTRPLLRQKASMPALSERKMPVVPNGQKAAASQHGQRPSTPGSCSELDDGDSSAEATLVDPVGQTSSSITIKASAPQGTTPESRSRLGLSRPRASTVNASQTPSARSSAELNNLVSPSTAAGTISQRRKLGGLFLPGNGQARDLESEAMQRRDSESGSVNMDRSDTAGSGSSAAVPFPGSGTNDRSIGTGSSRNSPISPLGRQRATSQPGSRRPSIPAAFITANSASTGVVAPGSLGSASSEVPPPLPNLARKLSALELSNNGVRRHGEFGANGVVLGPRGFGVATGMFAMPLPEPSNKNGLSDDGLATAGESGHTREATVMPGARRQSILLITDLFPSGLPSLAAGQPSYASVRGAAQPMSLPDKATTVPQQVPVAPHALLRPFCVMEQLLLSIQRGAPVTERLYVPQAVWMQSGVKLIAVEAKVRAIEMLVTGMETVERSGEPLLLPLGSNAGLETSNATRFLKQLDIFETLTVDVHNLLAKKLPFLEQTLGGSSTGTGASKGSKSFGTFGSRLTRGLDRMAGVGASKSMDSSSILVYVESLGKLLRKSSVFATHTTSLLMAQGVLPRPAEVGDARSPPSSAGIKEPVRTPTTPQPLKSPTGIGTANTNLDAYTALPASMKHNIHAKLAKSSDFFAKTCLAFILNDLGIMTDKFVKKGSLIFAD